MTQVDELKVVRADDEIPDTSFLAVTGIAWTCADARILLAVLSRVFAYGEARDRYTLYNAMSLLAPAVASPVATDDEFLPACLPPLPITIPTGYTVTRSIGKDASHVVRAWQQRPSLVMAAFPLDVMTKVMPIKAWPYLLRFLQCGPAEAEIRLDEALKFRAKDSAASTLSVRVTHTWIVMRMIKELRDELASANERRRAVGRAELSMPPYLDKWSRLPKKPSRQDLINMGAHTRTWDTSAVPVQRIREAMRHQAMKAEWGKYEPSSWPVGHKWMALKRLTVLSLFSTAPRIGTMHLLDVDDFAWHAFADGSEAWGIRFRGETMKMKRAGDVFWKKLPDGMAEIVYAWIICSGREIGQAGEPLITTCMIQKRRSGDKRYASAASLGLFVSGRPPSRGHEKGHRALIPFRETEWKGYQSHRFRSFVTQQVEALVHTWKIENAGDPLVGVDTEIFGELLTDHATRDIGYRDFGFKPRYERIVALGVALIWNSIWGDGARRKGIDIERIRDASDRVRTLEADVRKMEGELAQHEYHKRELKKRRDSLSAKARKASGEPREQIRLELDSLRDRGEDLSDEITMILRAEQVVGNELAAARSDLKDARTTEVVLSDDLTDELYHDQLASLNDDAVDCGVLAIIAPLSDELLPEDLADLFGVSLQTIWRWRTGRNLPMNPRPFDPAAWVMRDKKEFRLPIAAINVAAIPAHDPQAALDAVRRRRAALGFAKRQNKKGGLMSLVRLAPDASAGMLDEGAIDEVLRDRPAGGGGGGARHLTLAGSSGVDEHTTVARLQALPSAALGRRSAVTPTVEEESTTQQTVLVSDLTGREIETGNAAIVTIKFRNARRRSVVLTVNAPEVDDLAEKGRKEACRGKERRSVSS